MFAQWFQLSRVPAPMLQHLAGCFHKVPYGAGPMETGVLGPRDQVMDTVAELMEQRDDIVMLQETGLLRRRLGEVADQGRGRIVPFA